MTLKKKTLKQIAYDYIKGKIINCEYAPNAFINEEIVVVFIQPLSNPASSLSGADKFQPVEIRAAVGAGHNINDLGVFQRRVQGNDHPIRFSPHTVMSHLGVDVIGKVHGGGLFRQLHNMSPGGEHINGILQQFSFYIIQKF